MPHLREDRYVLRELELSSARSNADQAPIYGIPPRSLSAVEHPMIVLDHEKAIKTFGKNFNFKTVLDYKSGQLSVPLYPRYDNPVVRPVISHNAPSHNVVLRIEVPRRTGRKRKRGSDGPWVEADELPEPLPQVMSQRRLDKPKTLQQKLQDNVGKYNVEAIGLIRNTHRYRGVADFQYSTVNSPFMNDVVAKILPGDVSQMRQFSVGVGTAHPPGVEIVPPPIYSHTSLPFPYLYSQNPYVRAIDAATTVNLTAGTASAGYFISLDKYPVPTAPSRTPDTRDPQMAAAVAELTKAFEERPIWTRRSLHNRLWSLSCAGVFSDNVLKHAIPYFGYQFRGGPWRDAVIKYGLDPREDPAYRIYQTVTFKTRKADAGAAGKTWTSLRRSEAASRIWSTDKDSASSATITGLTDGYNNTDSHLFDGKTLCNDGKVWQVCDITDPLLARVFETAEVRSECETSVSGWYRRGLWAKAKAIMKCKMLAVVFGRTVTDADFGATLDVDDGTPEPTGSTGQVIAGTTSVRPVHVSVPLPDLKLSDAELAVFRGRPQSRFNSTLNRRKKNSHRTMYRVPMVSSRTGGLVREKTGFTAVNVPEQMTSQSPPESVGPDVPIQSVEDIINQDDDDDDDDDEEDDDDDDGEEDAVEDDDGQYSDGDEDDNIVLDPDSPVADRRVVRFAQPNHGSTDRQDEEGPTPLDDNEDPDEDEAEDEENGDDDGNDESEVGLNGEFGHGYDEERGFSSTDDY